MDPSSIPLKDIHLPDPVSWWPPAPGWWLIGFAVLACVVTLSIWAIRVWRRKTLRREAKAELEQITREYAVHKDAVLLAAQLSTLLRRACVSIYPRVHAAALTGAAWLEFLDRRLQTPVFAAGAGQSLIRAPYQKHCDIPANELIESCRNWIGTLATPS